MTGKLALLALNKVHFALPVEGIVHIIVALELFPLPLLPQGVGGVFLYKDQVTPLLDLPSLWGQSHEIKPENCPYTVICSCEVGLVGLPVDRVLHIVDLDPKCVKTVAGEAPETPPGFDRLFIHRDREYPVLNVESLLFSMPPKTITRSSPNREPRRLG